MMYFGFGPNERLCVFIVSLDGSRRREVEMHVRVALEPAVVLGLMGIEIVEDDVDGGVWIGRDDVVHEVEELDAPPTLLVRGGDLAGRHLEGGKQRRSAVALVIMAMTGQRPPIRELEIALRSLQRLRLPTWSGSTWRRPRTQS